MYKQYTEQTHTEALHCKEPHIKSTWHIAKQKQYAAYSHTETVHYTEPLRNHPSIYLYLPSTGVITKKNTTVNCSLLAH